MKRVIPKPSIGWLVPIGAVLLGVVLYLGNPVVLQTLRNTTFDQYQRWDSRPYKESPVRIIDIDDTSLAKMGQWPWPRTRIADLVRRLQSAGASAIAFDVIFAEPDRTSPSAMEKTWNANPRLRELLATLPDHDTLLAGAIAKGRVVLAHSLENDPRPAEHFAYPYSVATKGPSPLPYLHRFRNTIPALSALQDAAAGNGAINFSPDSDGILRKVPLLLGMGEEVVPSLIAEALRVSLGADMYGVTSSQEEGAGMESLSVGPLTIPTTREGEVWVRFTRGGNARTIPAWKVLAGTVPDAALRDHIVLIGTSAEGLLDLRFSPLGGIIPGVEAHAMALEQILAGDELTRPNWAPGLELSILVAGGLLVGFVALSSGAMLSAAIALLIALASSVGGWFAFSRQGLLIDPVTPSIVVLLSFTLSGLLHHISSERRQRWIRQAFARYVSPNLVAHLLSNPGQLELGGNRRECTFIFTDLAGFTNLMEKLDPAKAVSLLNEYLDKMIHIAFQHEGTLDRIVGDAVAIMFSAPVEQADQRERALRCAEEMHHFSSQFAADAQARGVPFGVTRIGVHSGEVTVGNFGGTTIFDYRALGDPVNTASRLESVNKQLGTLVCVSEATLSGFPSLPARPVGKLVLKGKTIPLMVYQPLFSADSSAIAPTPEYTAAYEHMARGDEGTRELFESLALAWPQDPLVKLHLKRLLAGQSGEVIVFTEK